MGGWLCLLSSTVLVAQPHPLPATQPRAGTDSQDAGHGDASGWGSFSPTPPAPAWPSPRSWRGSAPTRTPNPPPQQPCSGVPRGTKWLHQVPQEGAGMVASLSAPILGVGGWVGEKVPLLMAAVPSPPPSLSPLPPTWTPAPRHSSFGRVAFLQ